MNHQDFMRQYRHNMGSWPALVLVYSILVAGFLASGMALT